MDDRLLVLATACVYGGNVRARKRLAFAAVDAKDLPQWFTDKFPELLARSRAYDPEGYLELKVYA